MLNVRRKPRLASLTISFSIHRPLQIRRESKSSPQIVYDTVRLSGCWRSLSFGFEDGLIAVEIGEVDLDGRRAVRRNVAGDLLHFVEALRGEAGRQLRTQLRDLAIWPTRGSVSDIVGCSSCCGRRASPRASTASTGFIAKKASRCASGGLGGAPWGRGRRSWSNPSRTLAGRWISSMTNLPAAGGSAS
jgi:hypothetical protein